MKRIALIFALVASTLLLSGSMQEVSNDVFVESITEYIAMGNTSELAKNFNSSVELELLETENIYSKAQTELLLKDFFTRNKPSSFKINHQGNKGNTSFAIGTLVTSTGSFRVSVFMKTDNGKILIHQLRIEKS